MLREVFSSEYRNVLESYEERLYDLGFHNRQYDGCRHHLGVAGVTGRPDKRVSAGNIILLAIHFPVGKRQETFLGRDC